MHPPDTFWADVLSEDPTRIIAALRRTSAEERQSALAHLRCMADEDGWSEGQARRARFALDAATHNGSLQTPGVNA